MGAFNTIEPHCNILPPEQVGGKAFNLMKLHNIKGINVPNGFVLSTELCFEDCITAGTGFTKYDKVGIKVQAFVRWLANQRDKTWNDDCGTPLIVSARSGAPISMPGMMDTILNIGVTSGNLQMLPSEKFAYDAYRRLIQMYGTTVAGIPGEEFKDILEACKTFYLTFDEESNKLMVDKFKSIYKKHVGLAFPDDANEQLLSAINAVFLSWNSERAKTYRKIEGISDDLGTAAVVQEMVFGNIDSTSGTGVAFSHNPITGEPALYGDFLANAQGEDVVAGTHNTVPITKMGSLDEFKTVYDELEKTVKRLSDIENEILDIEFTIESGKLYILQQRKAKRTTKASVCFYTESVKSGALSPEDAASKLMDLLPKEKGAANIEGLICVGNGIGATDGTVAAPIAIGHEEAKKFISKNQNYIYVAKETDVEDVEYMAKAVGILTAKGGVVSHAAIIAINWNKPAVVGFSEMKVTAKEAVIAGKSLKSGDLIKINASTGEVWA